MATESELMQHRCAIFGTRKYFEGYAATLECLKESILESVDEGFLTFVTSAQDGYELDAAKFICGMKEQDPRIHLIITIPYANQNRYWKTSWLFEEVCNKADLVKVVSTADDPEANTKTNAWIVSKCVRILAAKNSQSTKMSRLAGFDLSEKEYIEVSVVWSEERNEFRRAELSDYRGEEYLQDAPKAVVFPYNLLCDVAQIDRSEAQVFSEQFPEDVLVRVFEAISKYGMRTQKIMSLRYCDNLTLQEIGDRFDLSRERVRQIIAKTINRLRAKTNMSFLKGVEILNTGDTGAANGYAQQTTSNWTHWTDEEIEQVRQEISKYTLNEIAERHGRKPGSIVRIIRTNNLLSGEEYYRYCGLTPSIKNAFPNTEEVSNANEKWTEEEETILLEEYTTGIDLPEIAQNHKRTTGAIISRLAKLTGLERYAIRAAFAKNATVVVNHEKGPISDDPISISEIARRMTDHNKLDRGAKIRYADISAWLVSAGDMVVVEESGKGKAVPTKQGEKHGIKREKRQDAEGQEYWGVIVSKDGQEYVWDHMVDILKLMQVQVLDDQ